MLAKLTSKNQLTLPKQAVDALGRPSHFTVEIEEGRLVLVPARPGAAAAVRRKLAELGIGEADIVDAVEWARTGAGR
ncbi:MAG: AbrB/MazE/SpoVT family DNA-binding domain-containing protein [Acetobacteraceae bacterium]|nr:AbrB/MazE/SpoVT family DNA-binding domain-containing protein [Acetobacteraceae bacterium]